MTNAANGDQVVTGAGRPTAIAAVRPAWIFPIHVRMRPMMTVGRHALPAKLANATGPGRRRSFGPPKCIAINFGARARAFTFVHTVMVKHATRPRLGPVWPGEASLGKAWEISHRIWTETIRENRIQILDAHQRGFTQRY